MSIYHFHHRLLVSYLYDILIAYHLAILTSPQVGVIRANLHEKPLGRCYRGPAINEHLIKLIKIKTDNYYMF